jgi:hypothetical protein
MHLSCTRLDVRLAVFLFVYGGIVHLLMFRLLAWPMDRASGPPMGAGIFALGGVVLSALFHGASRRVWSMTKFALLGVLATFLVFEIFLLCFAVAAVASGWRDFKALSLSEQAVMFGLAVLSVHTYNLSLLVYLLPVGLLEGLLAGGLITRFGLTAQTSTAP